MKLISLNPLMHNLLKWPDALEKSCNTCCKIFKVCLTVLGNYAFKCQWLISVRGTCADRAPAALGIKEAILRC